MYSSQLQVKCPPYVLVHKIGSILYTFPLFLHYLKYHWHIIFRPGTQLKRTTFSKSQEKSTPNVVCTHIQFAFFSKFYRVSFRKSPGKIASKCFQFRATCSRSFHCFFQRNILGKLYTNGSSNQNKNKKRTRKLSFSMCFTLLWIS